MGNGQEVPDHDANPYTTADGSLRDAAEPRAATFDGLRAEPKEPIVTGKLSDNVTFLVFDLNVDAARGETLSFDSNGDPTDDCLSDLGWFFTFEEPVGEVRFGLDVNVPEPDEDIRTAAHAGGDTAFRTDVGGYPAGIQLGNGQARTRDSGVGDVGAWQEDDGEEFGWPALSWGHVVPHDDVGGGISSVPDPASDPKAQLQAERDAVASMTHLSLSDSAPGGHDGLGTSPWTTAFGDDADAGVTWGANSAHMARITWQRPVRCCYHADDMLPDDAESMQN